MIHSRACVRLCLFMCGCVNVWVCMSMSCAMNTYAEARREIWVSCCVTLHLLLLRGCITEPGVRLSTNKAKDPVLFFIN